VSGFCYYPSLALKHLDKHGRYLVGGGFGKVSQLLNEARHVDRADLIERRLTGLATKSYSDSRRIRPDRVVIGTTMTVEI
jgi:hypothetical protein